MVASTRSARITGDPRAALAWSVEMTRWIRTKYNESAQCWARAGGPTGAIVWQMQFPDMGALEKMQQQLLSDDEYWDKVNEVREKGYFDPASLEDGIWTQLA